MDENKIAFIICVNDEIYFKECCWYLKRLIVPKGFRTEILVMRRAESMASGYNAAMKSSNAKYKVYLHQDVFIVNVNFISDLIAIFKCDEQIGMIGVCGGINLPEDGIMYNAWNCGRVIASGCTLALDVCYSQRKPYLFVEALDGMLMVTQYDIPWREDILKQWDYYDIAQSFEFIRAGFRLAIPFQQNPWTVHDCGYSRLDNYDKNRKIMFEEYPDFLIKNPNDYPLNFSKELFDLKEELYLKIKTWIDAGNLEEAKEVLNSFVEEGTNRKLLLMQQIFRIARMEEELLGKELILEKGFSTDDLLKRAIQVKFMIRRILLDEMITDEEVYQWIRNEKISAPELIVGIQENIVGREKALERFMQVYRLAGEKGDENILKMAAKILKNNEPVEGKKLLKEEEIGYLINESRWEEAKKALEDYKASNNSYSDIISILDASICFWEGKQEDAFVCISKGLAFNHENYELYFMLGNYYLEKNKNQAFLCYENAEFYCKTKDRAYLTEVKNNLLMTGEVTVQPVSIVILSYNGKEMTSLCVDSLRQSIPADAYELVIIDNASTDGSIEWLKQEEKVTKNLKVLYNKKNNGFPGGCNQGIKAAERKNDIFLLNNDTVAPPNAVFWLRMGLYENPRIGAVGSVSNHANNDQMIKEKLDGCEAYYAYGIKRNIPMIYAYEKKAWLMGFAVMFKREALEDVGYLDERFSPGNYEDNDIGIRFLRKGYLQLLCKNSFIFHFGSVGFRRNQDAFDRLLRCNRQKLKEKYELPIDEYSWVRTDMLDLIGETSDKRLSILDVGCGLGATMAKAESLFPNSVVVGIEKEEKIASIGKNLADVRWGDIEVMKLPFEKNSFDYILLGNVLECLKDPEEVLKRLFPFLKEEGYFIISISRNVGELQVHQWVAQAGLDIEVFEVTKIDYMIRGKMQKRGRKSEFIR